jgi:ATP-dependent RNA helicase HelY
MDRAPSEIPPPKLISTLGRLNLLPAIVFLPTRRKCDEAALAVAADRSQKAQPERVTQRQKIFDEFSMISPEIASHKHRKLIVNTGVASHHAGHIPAWKLLIEKMMSGGLLNAIFATSTVAAGVDFPARTVVISNADVRGNEGWRPLRASELQQMTGRAGRRGKDNVGFVILAPGQFQNPKKIAELLKAPPDALESQFRATYTSLLNLLDAFGAFAPVREIAEKSFAFRSTRHQIDRLERRRESLLHSLNDRAGSVESRLTVDDFRGYERLSSVMQRLQSSIPASRAEHRYAWLRQNALPGRIVTHGRSAKRLFIILNVNGDRVSAMRDDGQGATFELGRISRIYEQVYKLRDEIIEEAFYDVFENKNKPLTEPKPAYKLSTDGAFEIVTSAMQRLTDGMPSDALAILAEGVRPIEKIEQIERDIEFLKEEIWLPFESRARVLDHFGYLDFASETVSESGKWLADVRVDKPLLVGEALKRGLFEKFDISIAAGFMAALAADADRSYGEMRCSNKMLDAIEEFDEVLYTVGSAEMQFGIPPVEDVNISAAAATEAWAKGWEWESLVERTNAEQGDLVRLLSRTGEALLQVGKLREANRAAANIANTAAETILREPVR